MNQRKEQLEVVLDIDGVIADFEGLFCHRFGNRNRHLVSLTARYPDREQDIKNFVDDRSTYFTLLPLPIGIEIAKWLVQRVNAYGRRQSRANVTILTSRPFRTYEVTKKWLKQEGVPYHNMEFARNKADWMESRKPDICVDDIIDVCEGAALKVPGITPVLVEHPWNETPFFPRIQNLSQFQRIFQQVALEKLLDDSGGVWLAENLSGQ